MKFDLGAIRLALLSAAVLTAGAGFAQDDSTMVIRYRGDLSTLDAQWQSSINDLGVADNIYSQLLRYEPGTADIIGDLAESWNVSDDGLTYTFHLRQGVQFHRGFGELTAHDVKWSYDRMVDPESTSPGRFHFSVVESIETPDDYTVVIHLKEPHSPFLGRLAYNARTGIQSRGAIEQYGDDYTFNAVGSGPYMLERWIPGERIILVANPDYYEEGLPRTERIELVPIADDIVAAGAIETGELAFGLFRNPDVIARLEARDNLVVDRTDQSAASALFFRMDRAPFDNPLVREALFHAVNAQELVESVLTGVAVEAESFVAPFVPGALSGVDRPEYDPERARELLAEAGYDASTPLVLLSTQLEPWPLVVPILAFYLQEAGFNVEIRQLEHGTYGSERASGNYDMVVVTVTGPPDPDTWMALVQSGNTPPGTNSSYYANPEVDELITRATTAVDPDSRVATYERIQQLAIEDRALLPLFHLTVQMVRDGSVAGFPVPNAHDFKLKTVYWDR